MQNHITKFGSESDNKSNVKTAEIHSRVSSIYLQSKLSKKKNWGLLLMKLSCQKKYIWKWRMIIVCILISYRKPTHRATAVRPLDQS